MNIFKTKNILLFTILVSLIFCQSCDLSKKNKKKYEFENVSQDTNKAPNMVDAVDDGITSSKSIFENVSQDTNKAPNMVDAVDDEIASSKSLEEQFEELYEKLYEISPPTSVKIAIYEMWDETKLIKVPEFLMQAFQYNLDGENTLYAAKLPKYKNFKVIIVHTSHISSDNYWTLYTFFNNKYRHSLEISKVIVERDDDSFNETITRFSTIDEYHITLERWYRGYSRGSGTKEFALDTTTYIIDDNGEFVTFENKRRER